MYEAIYFNPDHFKLLTEPVYVVYCRVAEHPVLDQLCNQLNSHRTPECKHWNDFLEGIYRWRELCFRYEQYDPVEVTVKRLEMEDLNRWESGLTIQRQVKELSRVFDLEFNPSTYPDGQAPLELGFKNPAYIIGRAVETTLRDYQLKVYEVDFPQLQLSVHGGTACPLHLEYIRQLRILPSFYIRPHILRYLEPFLETYQYPYPEWFHSFLPL